MSNKDKLVYGIATAIIVILNVLMLTVFKSNDSDVRVANIVVIILVVFMFNLVLKFGGEVDRRKIKPERAGIWGVAASTVIWFINRIESSVISDSANGVLFLVIIGLGIFLISTSISRNLKRK